VVKIRGKGLFRKNANTSERNIKKPLLADENNPKIHPILRSLTLN
jgi:hypothetical protein